MKNTLGERTFRKYRGRVATGYFKKRKSQARWSVENDTVRDMIESAKPRSVLDIPFGEGRFVWLHKKKGYETLGIDSSGEMLALARRKMNGIKNIKTMTGDARSTGLEDRSYDAVLCIRFLDLIDEDSMRAVMGELTRIAKRTIICTIRLGTKYVCKVNTATHDQKKFKHMVTRAGFKVVRDVPVFSEGWHILQMERGA